MGLYNRFKMAIEIIADLPILNLSVLFNRADMITDIYVNVSNIQVKFFFENNPVNSFKVATT